MVARGPESRCRVTSKVGCVWDGVLTVLIVTGAFSNSDEWCDGSLVTD